MAQQRCYFLELPKELRLLIFEELLQPDHFRICSYDAPTIIGRPEEEVATTRFFHFVPGPEDEVGGEDGVGCEEPHRVPAVANREKLQPNILRTCREVYEEAAAMLYKPIVLELQVSCAHECRDESHEGEASRFPDLRKLSLLRGLQRLHVVLITYDGTVEEDVAHSIFVTNCFSTDLRMRCLSVDIQDSASNTGVEETIVFETFVRMLIAWSKVGRPGTIMVQLSSRIEAPVANWQKTKGGDWTECITEAADEDGYYDSARRERFFEAVKTTFSDVQITEALE